MTTLEGPRIPPPTPPTLDDITDLTTPVAYLHPRERIILAAISTMLDKHADAIAWALRTRGGVFPDTEPCPRRYGAR
jgi:hypothetical protein